TGQYWHKVWIVIGSAIIFVAILFCGFNLAYKDKVFPHTYIGSANFGGMSRDEAQKLLSDLEKKSEGSQLSFNFDSKEYSLSLADLDVNFQKRDSTTLDQLFSTGRSGSISKVLREQVKAIFKLNRTYAAYTYNQEKLDAFLNSLATDIDKPEKDATIVIKDPPFGETGNKLEIVPEEIGRKFPLDDNRQIALATVGSFNFKDRTKFLVLEIKPKVTTIGAQAALIETQLLLSRHLIIKAGDKQFEIFPSDVAGLISFLPIYGKRGVLGTSDDKNSSNNAKDMLITWSLSPELTPDKVGAYVDKIASEINQPAQDAKFEVTGGRVVAFQTAKTGYEIDKAQAVESIINALKNDSKSIELPVKVTEPTISDDVSANSFKELIGEGTTSWRGSPPNRIHNLTLGATKLSGTVVKPGEEFSTIKTIGVIGPSTGFLQELVIKNSTRVEPEYGGGLCQVSTTLFRAVLHSGLKITARTAHSFRVSYYEPPVGMDATIYDPAPDFKFINDYQTPILIWAIPGNNTLDFQIFGTKDGRKVEISDPVTYNYVGAGDPIYTESATMATGAIRQVERATSGASASFTYKVTAIDGNILENETFVSKYVAIPNSYLYGPGTDGIPGQESPAPAQPTPIPSPTPFVKETK
ncbi:MAG: hypothetical protein HW405_923, partial [Candidatus Berkelbacteria bacterium]|nr:hypothetical protein [Candidatus Berkelbacteria bacterium]